MQKIAQIGSDRFKKVSAEGHCSRLFRVTQPTAYTAYTSAFLCIDEAFKCLFEITYRGACTTVAATAVGPLLFMYVRGQKRALYDYVTSLRVIRRLQCDNTVTQYRRLLRGGVSAYAQL